MDNSQLGINEWIQLPEGDQEIEKFLSEYPIVKGWFPLIGKALLEYFGDFSELTYEVFFDRELADHPKLIITIISEYSPQETIQILNNFYRSWWFQSENRVNDLIMIDA